MRSKRPSALLIAFLATATAQAQAPAPPQGAGDAFGSALRDYHAALLARGLGTHDLRLEEVSARVTEAESLMDAGRIDETIARLGAIVEDPQFEAFAEYQDGRAAVFRLGDALATAGIDVPARTYLRRVLEKNGAWQGTATWARRAVRRLVDVALESGDFEGAGKDLGSVPAAAPEEVQGEIAYLNGRAREAAGDPHGALSAYALVTQRSRFWAEATYLSGLIHVEHGDFKNAENLFCKVADPKRSATTTPVFADEKFFAVRDFARLGLGRIAHEEGRNDNARYYYYLVPRDSGRLPAALYEAATTRYEKKDYEGAAELLDELSSLAIHHQYEDEAGVLGAWVDLARCRFADADKKLVQFLARYEPVRDAARHISESDMAMQRLLSAVHSGADAAGAEVIGASPETIRAVAALISVDKTYDEVLRRRAVLEREASGLVHALEAIGDMRRALATNGGVVRTVREETSDDALKAAEVRSAIGGAERQIAELEAAGAPADRVRALRADLGPLAGRLASPVARTSATGPAEQVAAKADLADLLRRDAANGTALASRIASVRNDLAKTETILAKDALHRLDLRLSRLLRRARLGRIESVLGRKRALEVEVEAIRQGFLPPDAVDSLDAARFLEDSEEYWPFEGDDWPDEYVGSEVR